MVPRGFLQVKFSDDTSLPGMITKEENTYRTGVQKLVECCDENLFASEYQQDQGISNRLPEEYIFTRPLQIKGQMVETVQTVQIPGNHSRRQA